MNKIIEIPVPDIGDFDEVEVIEILVNAGDTIDKEDSLISLESDKATMEIPSPEAGTVKEVKVALGDKVSPGSVILLLESTVTVASTQSESKDSRAQANTSSSPAVANATETEIPAPVDSAEPADEVVPYAPDTVAGQQRSHASPSVRRFADSCTSTSCPGPDVRRRCR